MKLFKIILFCALFSSCKGPVPEEDYRNVLGLLSTSPSGHKSVVRIDVASNLTYSGICLDKFVTLTPEAYVYLHPDYGLDNSMRKSALSTKSCADLGFSGAGSVIIEASGVQYNSYLCDPNAVLCASTAIQAAGF
ncbi:hypothetical protein CH373_02795 [Leptospira perolatii]|uniref:Lipoprotein n=1 Tax=Leptospira perolatii TaxID=2023191 RepID=A0A2M9ZSD1_9LEPT|nr:hypothetical protein [Leptospira perolatii]PJZ71442.1 hypothetical protein CH360_02795 [Leptospira perolatii]PJZ74976.1 hypothetical protein CH373_02795 [Leptospira perolatii]